MAKQKSPLDPARRIVRRELRDYLDLYAKTPCDEWERAVYVCQSILLSMARREGKTFTWLEPKTGERRRME